MDSSSTSPGTRSGGPDSYAATRADVAQRRAEAKRLVGERPAHVRYFTLDYFQLGKPGREQGLRTADPQEPAEAVWDFGDVHSVDFGVEIETAAGRVFTVTWDSPGLHEGIGLHEAPLVGSSLRADVDAVVWDVTSSPVWAPLLSGRIGAVFLDYQPWSDEDGGWWCSTITITSGRDGVILCLGETGADGTPAPSADNVLVLPYSAHAETSAP